MPPPEPDLASPSACPHHAALARSDEAQWASIRRITDTISGLQQAQALQNERLSVHLAEERIRLEEAEKRAKAGLHSHFEAIFWKALEMGLLALGAWLLLQWAGKR